MMSVYNETGIFLGYVEDESFICAYYDYEEYANVIIVLDTDPSDDYFIETKICK